MNDTAQELAERYSKAISVVADLRSQLAAERTTVSSLLVDLAAEKARADRMESALDALDDEWLSAIGENYMRMFGQPWETRDGETRNEGLQSNITALFQLIEDQKARADKAEAAVALLDGKETK